ncbi:MAG: hypothetical protein JWO32_1368 [Bacteroidetes bacterium]|nr:hypothetical protein [Bacteroidota bacterium]
MNNNTLYITFDGLSDPLGQSQILPYLTGLSGEGFHITILSCEKKDRLGLQLDSIQTLLKNTHITWNYIIYDEFGSFLTRLNYIRKLYVLAKISHEEKKFGLVHCRSYLPALIGLKFKKKYNVPFIFDMRGFWADERFDGNIWKKTNPLHQLFYKYFKIKEKQFFTNADAVISLTHNAVNFLVEKFAMHLKNKTTVIPCCVNTSLFSPTSSPTNSTLNSLGEKNHLLIYTGSIGTWYYTREMIDCIIQWQTIIPSIKLLIVTKDTEKLKTILYEYLPEQQQLIIHTEANYNEMPAILNTAKASIFFIKPAHSKIASSPTKMAECWAMNLPIITNSGIGDNDIYFNEHHGGILIKNFSKDHYLKACEGYLALLEHPTKYRDIALTYFDNKKAIKTYSGIYYSLIGNS